MENKKIDISSTAVEKGLDIAKSFLEKLIMPSVEEAGLLLKDQLVFVKFKQQVRMLNKAKKYCDKHKVNPKYIPLKLLSPMLEYAGIEEEETLHNKWAILLGNMVDSDQNIQNHVFPYILSQLSLKEYEVLEEAVTAKKFRVISKSRELDLLRNTRDNLNELDTARIGELKEELENSYGKQREITFDEIYELEKKLRERKNQEKAITILLNAKQHVESKKLQEFELANLIRLGLVKEHKEFFADSQTLEIPNDRDTSYLTVDIDIDVESVIENHVTELGELFITACQEKNT